MIFRDHAKTRGPIDAKWLDLQSFIHSWVSVKWVMTRDGGRTNMKNCTGVCKLKRQR
uniref:Uncharacterized protein MANES_06G147000 n=1 Tax=Rhizophora mucronata TaxID=61149 RepID=A0A2P2LCR4_RHIMU